MTWYVIHLFLLLLGAVVLGIIIGCLLRGWHTRRTQGATALTGATPASVGLAAAKVEAENKAARKSEEDAKAKAAADANKAAEDAKARAEADAARKAEEEAKAKAEADAAAKKAAEDAKAKAEADAAAKKAEKEAAAKAGEALSDDDVKARIAELPKDATAEQKADAVGIRPTGLSAPRGGAADDLKRIRGIGRVNEQKLAELGVFHFDQIASWTPAEARWVGTFLAFIGRIEREDWIGQAKVLAEGGVTDFAKRVDDGDVPSSQ